eukprot:gnl/TRDRNA2_/TRDRNA2_37755_c1_seq1.p1 gnl/TRDRNA2_/TRDRNA2_37755_c1~~gnl/TRDRNA2_/TRDRNA2_37755_c1_seq1.p1  ORF type:complete len:571 (+),score=91.60 gnl/TRDRNA2_/TRDRNA2_37755_c1_seq1:193-1713(+)
MSNADSIPGSWLVSDTIEVGNKVDKPPKHPLWKFEMNYLSGGRTCDVMLCSIALFFASILCSAGGIGGGGIFVTVLMTAGKLEPQNAVPLSKGIVFMGSLSSLFLNMKKTVVDYNNDKQALIDYNLCRLVVPGALSGTLLGVLLNRHLSDSLTVSVLCIILVLMTFGITREAFHQHMVEQGQQLDSAEPGKQHDPSSPEEPGFFSTMHSLLTAYVSGSSATDTGGTHGGGSSSQDRFGSKDEPSPSGLACIAASVPRARRSSMKLKDYGILAFLLVVVIVCGTLRFHSNACSNAVKTSDPHREACEHPLAKLFSAGQLESWMSQSPGHSLVSILVMGIPLFLGLMFCCYYSRSCIVDEGFSLQTVLSIQFMAIVTGMLAGLVGIGGGLIFSPFFLLIGVDPGVAVATSATCVVFTSSSTTMQYLFTDRIVISLTVVYGFATLIASWIGTSLVHHLQDSFATKKSYITGIVSLGLAISTLLAIIELVNTTKPSSGQAHLIQMRHADI